MEAGEIIDLIYKQRPKFIVKMGQVEFDQIRKMRDAYDRHLVDVVVLTGEYRFMGHEIEIVAGSHPVTLLTVCGKNVTIVKE